jgi:hypothetical protein
LRSREFATTIDGMRVIKFLARMLVRGLRLWWRIATVLCLVLLGFVLGQLMLSRRASRTLGR